MPKHSKRRRRPSEYFQELFLPPRIVIEPPEIVIIPPSDEVKFDQQTNKQNIKINFHSVL